MLPDLIVLGVPGLDSGRSCCCGCCGGGGHAGGARGHDGAGAPGEVVLATDPPQGCEKRINTILWNGSDSAMRELYGDRKDC